MQTFFRPRNNDNSNNPSGGDRTNTKTSRWLFRKSRRVTPESTKPQQETDHVHIFCDLIGVLVDLDVGVASETAQQGMTRKELWPLLQTDVGGMTWKDDGKILWDAIAQLQPDILADVPPTCRSRNPLFRWCLRELGGEKVKHPVSLFRHQDMAAPEVAHRLVGTTLIRTQSSTSFCRVITCWSKLKHMESGPNRILIDHRLGLKNDWEAKGGLFIHHTSASSTIAQLHFIGVLPCPPPTHMSQ